MRKSKNRYFTTFFPLGRRWGNHAKCCMDGKRTRCLQIVSLHVPIYLLPLIFWDTARYLWKKSSFYHTPLHSTPPLGGFPSEYRHPLWGGKTRMVSLSDGEKISKISLFVLTWSTNVTDRQTDRHCVTAKTALAWHRAVKIKSIQSFNRFGKSTRVSRKRSHQMHVFLYIGIYLVKCPRVVMQTISTKTFR